MCTIFPLVFWLLVAQSCPSLYDPVDCSPPGSSVGFFRQEHWSDQPFPFPGDLPDPGIETRPPALEADSLPSKPNKDSSFLSFVIQLLQQFPLV